MTATDRVMLFDEDADRAASIVKSLGSIGLTAFAHHRNSDAPGALRREAPAVAVLVGGESSYPGLAAAARSSGIATLALIGPDRNPAGTAALVRGFDDWAPISGPVEEVAARVAGLLEGRRPRTGTAPIDGPPAMDPRFLGLVVHDLRTPLNVLVLTIHSIAHSVPERTDEFLEELSYLTDNTRQIEKMLVLLGDYCRLLEGRSEVEGTEFDPRRFLADFLEDRQDRGIDPNPVRLELAESCPAEVALDPIRAKLALQYALANTVAAAGDSPIRLRASGRPGRLLLELILDKPPADTVKTALLRPGSFERLIGIAADRRGLDLAIATSVTELFGGTARLEVEPGRRSTLVLDWPERIAVG